MNFVLNIVNEEGTILQSSDVAYGETPVYTGETPTKAATAQFTYTFEGWTPEIKAVDGEATYTVKYNKTVNEYTVEYFDGENELTNLMQIYKYGDVLELNTIPEKTHFIGAWELVSGTVGDSNTVIGDLEYKAVYTDVIYTVTFKIGEEVITKSGKYGDALEVPAIPEVAHKTVTWNVIPTATIEGNADYEVIYTDVEYTVIFVIDDTETEIKGAYGTALTAPSIPEKTGYTGEWDKSVPETVQGDDTFTVVYTINSYKVTWMVDEVEYKSTDVVFGGVIPIESELTKEGYTFSGWSETPSKMPAENITITAHWSINKYTITFDTDGGSEIVPVTQDYDTAITVPEIPTKSGYTFKGWNPVLPETMPAENITVTAIWEITPALVSYKIGDKIISNEVGLNSIITLPEPTEEVTACFVPEVDGEAITNYTFYWKLNSIASLTEENAALESNIYFLPGTEFTVSDNEVVFTPYWDYSGAEIKLIPNANKAVATEHEFVFDIYVESEYEATVTKFESGEFTIFIETKDNTSYSYELTPNDNITFDPDLDGRVLVKRTDGNAAHLVPEQNDASYRIYLGSIKVIGAGEGSVTLSNAVGHRHVVDGTDADNLALEFGVRSATEAYNVFVPTAELAVTIDFKNTVSDNTYKYQDMTLTVSGGDLDKDIIVKLGNDANFDVPNLANREGEAITAPALADDKYVVTFTNILAVNRTYTVTIEGAGYRTTRYTVTMTECKELYFWNNVMDNITEIEEGKKGTTVTFLAGDIVKDSVINIYDLSAVVSYFGEIDLSETNMSHYAKYDLNRDGKIDSKDVAYVLVSWGK